MKRELQLAAAGVIVVGLLVLVARHGSSQPGGSESAAINSGSASSGVAANASSAAGDASPADDNANSSGGDHSPGLLARFIHSERSFTIPDGTRIDVRLDDALGSARNRGGDTFQATLDEPIQVNGDVVVPTGTSVTGRVVAARPSGHVETPPVLAVTLTSVEVDGKPYELATSTDSWRGKSHKRHDAKWIGGLAGAGALFGALAGHGAGAAIGASAGAGAGTAGAYATGKKDITLSTETRLRFVLRRPVSITKAG